MVKPYMYIGYHGTSRDSAEKIRLTGFRPSVREEDWLGSGVYFFENDFLLAKAWCSKVKKYGTNWAILRCKICADTVLDLLTEEGYEAFRAMAHKIKDRYHKLPGGGPRRNINKIVVDLICNVEPVDVIRGAFDASGRKAPPRTNVLPVQVQLCVRNTDCITIQEVYTNEH